MLYTLVLFAEIAQLDKFSEVLYNKKPYLELLDFSMPHLFFYWMIVLCFLFAGLFTRLAAILNYIFAILVFSQQHLFEYHVFYAYVGINFLFLFMPVSRVLSLDALVRKLKYSTIGKFYQPEKKVYAINYFIPVLIGIGLVYFDSVLYKITSPMWMKGLGMWLPANIPKGIWNNLSFVMNNEFLVKFLGYLVLIFETCFLFLMWFKRFRWPFFFIGLFFHLGILICYPIPWFALTVVVTYFLMVPVGVWKKINFRMKEPRFIFYYDYECPLCIKTVVFFKHFDVFGAISFKTVQGNYSSDPFIRDIPEERLLLDIYSVDLKRKKVYSGYESYAQLFIRMGYTFIIGYLMKLPVLNTIGKSIYKKVAAGRGVYRCTHETCAVPVFNEPVKDHEPLLVSWLSKDSMTRKGWKYFIIILLVFQVVCSLFSAYPSNLRKKIPGYTAEKESRFFQMTKPFRDFGKNYFGITNHPVFMDSHFKGYNHIFRVTYLDKGKEITLPVINDNGMPGEYIRGAFWVNYTFRVSAPAFNVEQYNRGIRPYLLYWLYHKGKGLTKSHHFNVYVKEVEIPEDWEKDFLNKQLAKPWKPCGSIDLNNGELSSTIDPSIH